MENILFRVTPANPLERYDYWKKCRYAYCSFRERKKDFRVNKEETNESGKGKF